ncbi:hypothetical protein ACS0TY_013961 [Phlomoides rotata]
MDVKKFSMFLGYEMEHESLRYIGEIPRKVSFLKLSFQRYKVIEVLAGGGCALVEWRLETGRTHQIRAHAKYLGIPLLGDDVYGGTKSMALSLLQSRNPSIYHAQLLQLIDRLERPCLHALTLGFRHPNSGENLSFSKIPPPDFSEILDRLRNISAEKTTYVVGNFHQNT